MGSHLTLHPAIMPQGKSYTQCYLILQLWSHDLTTLITWSHLPKLAQLIVELSGLLLTQNISVYLVDQYQLLLCPIRTITILITSHTLLQQSYILDITFVHRFCDAHCILLILNVCRALKITTLIDQASYESLRTIVTYITGSFLVTKFSYLIPHELVPQLFL